MPSAQGPDLCHPSPSKTYNNTHEAVPFPHAPFDPFAPSEHPPLNTEPRRAVKDLEQSLLELHQIFLDMAVLVEAQGEMLDNIEKQARGASQPACRHVAC